MTVAPAWVAPWIGKPFEPRGRGPESYDCWGLVCAVARERWGVDLPSHAAEYSPTADRAELAQVLRGESLAWREVAESDAREGDAIELRILGSPCHVGLVVAPGWFLHTSVGVRSCVERWDRPAWRRRVIGFHRHEEIAHASVR